MKLRVRVQRAHMHSLLTKAAEGILGVQSRLAYNSGTQSQGMKGKFPPHTHTQCHWLASQCP
eukprot:10249-Prymnesium_polylepis.1